jgi:hypothetical protein
MANEFTSTLAANLGQASRNQGVYHTNIRPVSPVTELCAVIPVDPGTPSSFVGLIASNSMTFDSYSEAGGAVANQAVPVVNASTTVTPAQRVTVVAPTSPSVNRVDPGLIDVKDWIQGEMSYPASRYLAHDSTVGILKRFQGLSNVGGTSGATMTFDTILAQSMLFYRQIGGEVDVVVWLSQKQWNDVQRQAANSTASAFGVLQINEMFLDLMHEPSMNMQSAAAAYRKSLGPLHFYVEPDATGITDDGTDEYGAMFVPSIPGLNGSPLLNGVSSRYAALNRNLPGRTAKLAPAFAVAYRVNPLAAQEMWRNATVESMILPNGTPVQYISRAHAGPNLVYLECWGEMTTIELADASGRALISVKP